ncbi:substrate-binding domain-containing protein [Sanguibacter sp. 25GB23B1]|uniref:substrate-binding domain-containing protein n=1 Tax=unclassified Sanguibacter TaxID=2645534 RepID=UPI0032AF396D
MPEGTTVTPGARGALPVTRRAQVLDALQEHGTVRVSELVDALGVTAVTVRRDIAQLAEEGLVRRVHGGATLVEPLTTTPAGSAGSGGSGTTDDDLDLPFPVEETPIETVVPSTSAGASRPTHSIGMLVPSLDYYWPGVVRGAEQEARDRGMRIVLRGSSYESVDDRPQLERLLETSGVDGFLVAPNMSSPRSAELVAWLASIEQPVVLVERTATVAPYHEAMESVVTDHALGAAVAVRHLADLGHRRIGLVLSTQSPTAKHLRAGYLQATSADGLTTEGVVDEAYESDEWDSRIDAILDDCLSSGTTALLIHSDPEAMALVQRCEERGLSVPGDLSVVAYDDEIAGLFSPALTAVRPPRTSVGRAAISLLADRLRDPGRPTHRVVISPSLRLRESSGPPTRTA